MMSSFLILGGVSYDTIVPMKEFPKAEPATLYSLGFHETVGSTGAGKALCLHKLGAETNLLATAGDDEHGNKISRYLAQEGLSFYLDHDPTGTERHVNLMDEEGRRISIFLHTSSADSELNLERAEELILSCDYAVLNIVGYCKKYIPLLQKYNKEIWCDLHDYNGDNPFHSDFINAAHYLFLSSDNLPDYRPQMEKWIKDGKKLVVCTHGSHGATALTAAGQWLEIPIADQYERVDSNGAGDNFFAGFLYAYSLGCSLEQSLQAASIVAGLCITSKELVAEDLSALKLQEDYEKYYGSNLL
ncbi:carbohydrate kinase family protein [Paenibacillus wynnii]|uniref:carbohydrate kinase family protein n=1 Tax=Paenibacillus wynnii TaxID=268407 RepID=UPI002790F58D|nr:carbohydrate kinase family protein [Paenibacillus wynnii]MDQ0196715.1 sugar/nucleoside kinase (ribokinase family) [Paenibacillus wynnii]